MSETKPTPPWEQSWAERHGGWEHRDSQGRWLGLRYSRFHGLMVSTNKDTVYVDEAEPSMRAWLADQRERTAAAGDPKGVARSILWTHEHVRTREDQTEECTCGAVVDDLLTHTVEKLAESGVLRAI